MRVIYFLPIALLIVLCMTGIQGCKKKSDDSFTVTIVNRLDKDVTLDMYGNAEDYASNSNPLGRHIIKGNGTLMLPGNDFKTGATYYMDWYTEDYYYNNWFNDDYPITESRVRIAPKAGNSTYYLEPGYKGNNRISFLKGAGTETGWIAVGAYLYTGSTGYSNQWDVISTNERYRQITVKKNFTANYTHKDADGKLITDDLTFLVQTSEVPYIEFQTKDGGIGGNMTGGKLPVSTADGYASNSVDTVMALFPDNEFIFMMVRQ